MSTNWHSLSIPETMQKLATNLQIGLTTEEVAARQKIYPRNEIITYKKDNVLFRFLRQFHNALIYILLVSAVIAVALEQWLDAGVILGVVIINAIFGFFQEGKAEKALSAIRAMLSPVAQVIRDGRKITIAASNLLPGDIVVINRGDKVPADLRLCEAKNIQVEEAILTGESLPVEKQSAAVIENAVIGERYSMLYSGTLVTDGRGLGIVVATGLNTEVGKISESLQKTEAITTPLLRQMNKFGQWLTLLIVALALVVFLVGALVWHNVSSEMFMAIVGLTVAAIPEGLPPIMTIILAIGVTRMAKLKAIVRNLPAVETMGAVTTICTDKTGTLTSNELAVQSIITAKNSYEVSQALSEVSHHDLQTAIAGAILCNDATLSHRNDVYEANGNPLDEALMMLGVKLKYDVRLWQQKFPRTDLIPYETEHKFMATLHHDHAGNGFLYVKGAPEIILRKCKAEQADGKVVPLDADYWYGHIERLASLGQRVIAVAIHKEAGAKQTLNFSDVDEGLVLVALLGLIDPPRKEAIIAVKECQDAGIDVKMITGDHVVTARTIALNIGIKNPEVLTGDIIDQISDDELGLVAQRVDIYARTSPHHKLRLVKALQRHHEVVAMTGDGINDAPALKQADIGVAMGQKGADLAKESAAMVLADDNFATIVHAVREGRTIFDNLQKAILFVLPTSFAQAFAVIVAILFGLTLPITAVQILWVNMITAVTLSLAFGFEPAEAEVMSRPPRDSREPLLSWYLLWRAFLVSLIAVVAIFGLFVFVYSQDQNLAIARTVVVNVLVFCEAVYLINCRNLKKSSINVQAFFGSLPVLVAIGTVMAFQLLFTYLPVMQRFFHTADINWAHWGYILVTGVVAFGLVELEKVLYNRSA